MVDQKQVFNFLSEHKLEMRERFNINRLAIFGSVARNEASNKSDIDILVSFVGKASSKNFFGLQFYLEDKLEQRIDLVSEKSVRKELRPYIEKDAIYV